NQTLSIHQLALEKITLERGAKTWIVEAIKAAAPLIKQAKEILKQIDPDHPQKVLEGYQKALKDLETAVKIQAKQQGNTTKLNAVISSLKKDLFFLQIKYTNYLYLSPEQMIEFDTIIDLYRDEEDIFSCLSAYLSAFEDAILFPHLHLI